jgi:hypothetical protein
LRASAGGFARPNLFTTFIKDRSTMALITEVIEDHFRTRDDLEAIVMSLDTGIYTVGLSVSMIRDMALHGSPGSPSSECDVEEVATVAEGLLAYLGVLGQLVDRLELKAKAKASFDAVASETRSTDAAR